MPETLEAWLAGQAVASEAGLRACISATHLIKRRPRFGQVIVPAPGSVLASPNTESDETRPDYFFHWLRDSALFMDVVSRLAAEQPGAGWNTLFEDFVLFSLSVDGTRVPSGEALPEYRQHLRPPSELAALHGEALLGEPRYNADGSLDTLDWGRPQFDGPALRALVCMRHAQRFGRSEPLDRLIRRDLAFTASHAGQACVDLWEESSGRHYYTIRVQQAALRLAGNADAAPRLDGFEAADGTYRPSLDRRPEKTHDIAVVLAALHTQDGFLDPRMHATLDALERQFAAAYPINHDRPAGRGVAFGRFIGDRYLGCGPWYLCSFGAAEFCYHVAAAAHEERWIGRGDAILEQVRWTIPPSGALSEQFSPEDGRQLSAPDLGWSHAAFLTARWARDAALRYHPQSKSNSPGGRSNA